MCPRGTCCRCWCAYTSIFCCPFVSCPLAVVARLHSSVLWMVWSWKVGKIWSRISLFWNLAGVAAETRFNEYETRMQRRNKADRHKSRAHTKELTHIKTLHWPTHLQIWILGHLHTWTLAYLDICILAHLHTCTFAYLHICILAHWHTYTLTYLHIGTLAH